MAVVVSIGTGNWLTAGTWGLVDAASYSNSETTGATPPTSSGATSRSNAFTPAASTIDAVGIKFRNRTGTTGTMTVAIVLDSDNSVQKTVTVNMSDLPPATTAGLDGGWIVFKFGTGLVVDGLTAYKIDVITSSATQASVFSSAGNNWSRLLVTSTTQAPVAGDDIVVAGSWNSAGSANVYVVTMNETAATDYGSNTTSTVTPALAVCQNGTLTYNAASAGNPLLRLSGCAIIYNQGIFSIGTTGTPIPRDSVAILEFDSTADGGHALRCLNGYTFNSQGLSRTVSKNIISCKLNTDEAINSTSLGVDSDTGWLDNDQIAVASTTRTVSQSEIGTLNGNAGASTLTVDGFGGAGGGLAAAHSGTSPIQAEVILLSRNIKIRSVSSTLMAYVYFAPTGTADIDWTEFYYLGDSPFDKRGIEVLTTTGLFSMQYSSMHDVEDGGVYLVGTAVNNVTISYNVFWNLNNNGGGLAAVSVENATSGTSIIFDNNIVIKTNLRGYDLLDVGITFTNNTAVSCGGEGFLFRQNATLGTISGNVSHSNTSYGVEFFTSGQNGTFGPFTAWRNGNAGIALTNYYPELIIDSPILFGNSSRNIYCSVRGDALYLINPILSGDTSFSTPYGIECNISTLHIIDIKNGDMSTVSGIKTAHTTADILVGSGTQLSMSNTIMAATAPITGIPQSGNEAFITAQRFNGIAEDHRAYNRSGVVKTDSAIFHTATPSQRCTPSSATIKLESALKKRGILAAVVSTETVTISVWVRKSIAGDSGGVLYAGNQPRLIQRANPAIGFNSDVVLDTMTVADASGTWEQLVGTTGAATDNGAFEFVVDCDGTSGAWINVDDWAV